MYVCCQLQIVGLGLRGVFELVRETRDHYPELCIKAMKSLLDMLQGQLPESMKLEPVDIVGKYWYQAIHFMDSFQRAWNWNQ